MGNAEKKMGSNDIHFSQIEEFEILKIAVEQMNIQVFVYDTLFNRIYFFKNKSNSVFGELNKEHYSVEDMLEKKVIDPEYAERFRALFRNIESGEKMAEARIRFLTEEGDTWNNVMIFNCCSLGNTSHRAIGTLQNISSMAEAELQYSQEQKYRMAMLADFHRIFEINVTKDRFVKLESIQDSTDSDTWDPYTKTMNFLRETRVYREDWDVFLEIANRDNLLKGFCEGRTEFYCEYRVVEDGTAKWSSSATHLLKDPVSDDIKGFIYIKDIDEQKKRELELAQQAETDPLTGIYNRRTAQKLITKLLLAPEQDNNHYAFLTLDMDDFKYVNDKFGHVKGDFLLKQMAQKISYILTDKDIFARLGGDEFIIFLYIGEDKERLERISNLIITIIQAISIEKNDPYRPSVSIGVSTTPEWGVSFEALYETSDHALYRAKKRGKGCIELYRQERTI